MIIKDKEFVPYLESKRIQETISQLASRINVDYAGKTPLLLAVLNGSFMFAADLMRNLNIPVEISFIRLSSYKSTRSSGRVKELIGLEENIFGRHLIIVEDIVDTGLTMRHLLNELQELGPKSLEVATLLHKSEATKEVIDLKYVGFVIPKKFVVGYGLDYDGQGRNLNDIYSLAN
ncbi:hypoxanthine phosphoribosyltransferase [Cesiribacter sp. SM1]|uniref:hypoxanthine phosphoribosyltransferase n=1 Tax=Cesiribacter sp. SM1 TaxID=2861196 RepID=UPI001CD5A584|nr:hypoxanthine phosphoribosyltransferase [Cesiribacter sp. SM1]